MSTFNRDEFSRDAEIYKSLGHPFRLWIMKHLAECSECCVSEIAEASGVDVSSVSQHLGALKKAGLIKDKKSGLNVFYRIAHPAFTSASQTVGLNPWRNPHEMPCLELFNSIEDAVVMTDEAGCISYMNPIAERLVGADLKRAMGEPHERIFRFVSPLTGKELRSPIREALEKQRNLSLEGENELRSTMGDLQTIGGKITVIYHHSPEEAGAVMVFRDITEEKQEKRTHEEILNQQKTLVQKYQDLRMEYQTLLDAMPVYFYVEDVNDGFKHINCNRICAELWGKTIEEVIGKGDDELFPDSEEVRKFRETDIAAAESGKLREDILPITGSDGIRRMGKFYRRCLSFPDGRKWLFGIVFDVTEEIERQQRLNSLLRLFEYTAELAQTSPFQFDLESGRVEAPAQFSNLWPLRDGKAIPIEEFVYGEDFEKVMRFYHDVSDGKNPSATFEFRSNFFHEMRYFRTKMELKIRDRRKTFIGVIQDVTELTNAQRDAQNTLALQNLIINTVPGILFAKDITNEFRYVIANKNTETLIGVEPGGLLGRKDSEFRNSRWVEDAMHNDRMLLDSRRDSAVFLESTMDSRGVERVYKMTKSVYYGAHGEKLLLAVGSDITDQMDLIENQKDLNKCFSEIMMNVGKNSQTIILGLLGNRMRASRAFLLRFDYPAGKVLVENEYRADTNAKKLDSVLPFTFTKQDRWYMALMCGKQNAFPDASNEMVRAKIGVWDGVNQALGIKSIYWDKIVIDGELWGVFGISYEREMHEMTSNEQTFFSSCANLFSMMLERRNDIERNERTVSELHSALAQMEWGADLTQSGFFYLNRITRKVTGTRNLEKLYPHRNGKALLPKEWIAANDLNKVQDCLNTIYNGDALQTDFNFRSSYYGNMRYFRVLLRRDRNSDGNTFFGIIQDVTKIMINATKIKESQELCELSFSVIPSFLFVLDADDEFRFILCNKAFSDFVGFTEQEIIGKNFLELPIPENMVQLHPQRIIHAAASTECTERQDRITGKNGEQRLLRTTLKPFVSTTGRHLLIGSCVDITDMDELVRNEKINGSILSEAVSVQEYDTVISRIFETLMNILKCDRILLVVKGADEHFELYREHCAAGSHPVGKQICRDIFAAFQTAKFVNLKQGKPVFLEDLTSVEETQNYIKAHPDYLTRSCAVSPIMTEKQLYGMLIVTYNRTIHFRPSDVDLMKSMCCVINLLQLRDRQQKIMREAEAQNQAILDNINIPLWLYNRDGVIVKMNQAAIGLMRNTPEHESKPYSCREAMQCHKSEEECCVRKVFQTGKVYHCESDPGTHEYLIDICPIKDLSGNVTLAVKSIFEVTKLNHLMANQKIINDTLSVMIREQDPQVAIQHSIGKIREYAKASLCFIFKMDVKEKTVSCVCENFGSESSSIFGQVQNHPWGAKPSWETLFQEQDVLVFHDFKKTEDSERMVGWLDLFEKRDIRSCYACRIMFHGKLWGFACLVYEKQPFEASEDTLNFFRASAHCIELLLIRKEYRENLLTAIHQAQDAEKAKSTFLASMSHEIRTPLNAVIGFADLLKDQQMEPAVQNDYLSCISNAGNALLALINDVLDLSKLEAGQMTFRAEQCDFGSIVNEVKDIFRTKCSERKLALVCDIPADFPMVWVDKLRIRQVLFNLIGNAVKFTDAGSITVHAKFCPDTNEFGTFTFDVTDTGIGISEQDQKKLFRRFVQADGIRGTQAAKNGTGLGLALCRRMIEQMNGEVSVQSEIGRGSCFQVILTKIRYASKTTTLRKSLPEKGFFNIKIGRSCRVLLVDDVPMNLKVMSAMLRKLDVDITEAKNGDAALVRLGEQTFDFVMTDLWMPGMSGVELAQRIHKIPRYAKLPIAAVTADTENDKCFDMSVFDGIITKPVSLEKMVAFLNKRD